MQSTFKTKYDLNDSSVISAIDDLPLWSAPFGIKLLEKVCYRKHIKALDIGSGNGFPVVELASRLGGTCEVFGIDPWKEANDRVRQKVETWGITNLKIIESEAEKLPFGEGYFDLVISNNGINNVEDDKKVLREVARVTRQNAQLVITVNLPGTMIEFYSVLKEVIREQGLNEYVSRVDEHIHSKRKPIEYTRQLIQEAGFKILGCEEDGFEFKYTDGTSFLNHFFTKLAFKESWMNLLPKEKVEDVFNKTENKLNIIADGQNGLSMSIPFVCINALKK